jgi:hypothetical protein
MRTGSRFAAFVILVSVSLCGLSSASSHSQRKAKKPQLPPLPSGPLGPVPQVPLDSTPAVAPHVSYTGGQLTIIAPNSTLGDILRAVRKQTSAEMDVPASANERVVTQLGPGPAREVVAELLNGSRFNYVLLGSPADASALTRVVLVAKTGSDVPKTADQAQPPVAGMAPGPGNSQPEVAEAVPDAPEEAPEENADENTDQNAEAEQQQPGPPPDQPGIKTPQQMLQEMQQRQLQMQQQQQPGQPPVPGGYPQVPRPPEQQQ